MPATSQISKPQVDKTATQVDEAITHADETSMNVGVSRPRVSQNRSKPHATNSDADDDNNHSTLSQSVSPSQSASMSQGTSVSQDQGLPRGTNLSQGQENTSLSQSTKALLQSVETSSSEPHTSEALSLKVLLDEDKPDTQLTPNTSITQLASGTMTTSDTPLAPVTKTLTKNFRRYVRENPAQTLCGLTITSLLTIVAILLGSSLTSTNARFADVNSTMNARFAEVNNTMDNRFTEVNNTMNARFAEVNTRFNAIDNKFNAIDNKFDTINDKFDTMNDKFNNVNVQLAKLITALNLDTTN